MKYGFDLITSDDGLSVTAKAVDYLYLRCEKEKDTAVLGEIQRIATENGIDTYLTLNEKAIIMALSNAVPSKPHPLWNSKTKAYSCPACIMSVSKGDRYCRHCGKKLDWSDTE